MTSTDTPFEPDAPERARPAARRHWARRARTIGPVGFALGFVLAAAQNVPPTTEPAAVRTTTVTVTASARATSRTPAKTVPPAPAKAAPQTIDQDGTYLVGDDIQPGRWKASGTDGGCYWARLRDTEGNGVDSIIANSYGRGRAIVTIKKSDVAFTTKRCGTWTRQ